MGPQWLLVPTQRNPEILQKYDFLSKNETSPNGSPVVLGHSYGSGNALCDALRRDVGPSKTTGVSCDNFELLEWNSMHVISHFSTGLCQKMGSLKQTNRISV